MQPIPGCRIRVWKKEWQQTVGSQTSLTTGTRRIANRDEQRSRGEGEEENKVNEQEEEGGIKYREEEKGVEKANVKGERRKRNKRKRDEGDSKRRGGRQRG